MAERSSGNEAAWDESRTQTAWEETDAEAQKRYLTRDEEPGWTGTIIGLLLAVLAIAALLLTR